MPDSMVLFLQLRPLPLRPHQPGRETLKETGFYANVQTPVAKVQIIVIVTLSSVQKLDRETEILIQIITLVLTLKFPKSFIPNPFFFFDKGIIINIMKSHFSITKEHLFFNDIYDIEILTVVEDHLPLSNQILQYILQTLDPT